MKSLKKKLSRRDSLRFPSVVCICLLLAACSNEQKFEVLSGDSARLLSDERILMINYWATWCLPCIEEMPELAEFRYKHNEKVEIYAVNYDNPDLAQLAKDINKLGVEIPSLLEDPYQLLGYQRPIVLPTTVVLHKGEVKEVLVGPQTSEKLEEVLDKWVM